VSAEVEITKQRMRRIARRIAEKTEALPGHNLAFITTTVATVTASASRDGTYQIAITLNADTILAPYLAAYSNGHTPTVGDTVAVLLSDGSPLILDRIRGLPTF
jgi:hypothetical protein